MFLKKNPCTTCDAKCCKYITIEIDTPETIEDFENIRWYVAHKNTEVSVEEDGSWWVKFITPCKNLNKQNQCDIYKTRPLPCKEFSSKTCPTTLKLKHKKTLSRARHGILKQRGSSEEGSPPWESLIIFKNIEEVDKYIKEIFKKGRHTLN